MENIQNLLNQVSLINKKHEEILDATGGRFNMFRVCGINHDENKHSAIIAEFLNPKGSHGLKSKLLECFIETLGESFTIQNFNCEKARVTTEHSFSDGRIDIIITDNQGNAIIIENKIYAGDQPEQLKRYDNYAVETYKERNYQILYLTLSGGEASEQSGGGVKYLPISHKETIIKWLDKCVAIAARFPMVRETINQYINHLKQLTNQDMDTKHKEEIVEFLCKPENLKAAQKIHQNYNNIFDKLAKKHFHPKMKKFADDKGLKYSYSLVEESLIAFKFESSKWGEKRCIYFSHDAKHNYQYGLFNMPENKIPDETMNIIREHLKKSDIFGDKPTNYMPFNKLIGNLTIDTWISDIINSPKFFEDCKKKIETLLEAIEKVEF